MSFSYLCVGCKTPVYENKNHELVCDTCFKSYPIFNRSIPILLDDAHQYLINNFYQYERFIKIQNSRTDFFKDKISLRHDKRKAIYESIILANQVNAENMLSIQEAIYNSIDLQYFENISPELNQQVSYLNSLEYLKRDWCGNEEDETELAIIRSSLFEIIKDYSPDKENIFFLGAGAGRLVFDSQKIIQQVYAVDSSLAMVRWFHELNSRDIVFYEIESRNKFYKSDIVQKRIASQKNSECILQDNNELHYFVGDATKNPFKDNFFSSIASIYFTDTVPIEKLVQEVYRLLKTNGLFFHFGPLNYHFKEIEYMLAADEIVDLFISQGFQIVYNTSISTTHLSTQKEMKSLNFKNWVFAAIKR